MLKKMKFATLSNMGALGGLMLREISQTEKTKTVGYNLYEKFKKCNRAFPQRSVGKESACNSGDPSLIPGSGRSAGEGIGYLLV